MTEEEGLTQPLLTMPRSPGTQPPSKPGWLSRLTFWWVTPLMRRGAAAPLQHEDLPGLEPALDPAACAGELWQQWCQECQRSPGDDPPHEGSSAAAAMGRAALLWAIARAYGRPYAALGLIKLANDALNFTGPLLLNGLVHFLGSSDSTDSPGSGHRTALGKVVTDAACSRPAGHCMLGMTWIATDTAAFGCSCAALLGLSSLLKALLSSQYSYQLGRMACRLRAALTCTVFRKTLLVNSADMAAFSSGAAQTLMSVDADTVVGLCLTLHELWSLPLQIGVALWLLYTQVQYAFLAGLGIVVLLIPANRWLALRIEAASRKMMACKDTRVKRAAELLRGIRQIKMAAWGHVFVAKVMEARKGELRQLAVRKYLDALCVYCWAATSLLFSTVTFGLYALLGQQLTAAKVFTSLALFNVLIAPLNSFPWVINGAVEAVVSVRRLQAFLCAPDTKAAWLDTLVGGDTAQPLALPGASTAAGVYVKLPTGGSDHAVRWQQANGETGHAQGGNSDVAAADVEPEAASPAISLHSASFAWTARPIADSTASDKGRRSQPAAAAPSAPSAEPANSKAAGGLLGPQVLHDISLDIPRRALVVIYGQVGAGKSSLLAAMLGELHRVSGRVSMPYQAISYVPQQPWLVAGTVRENVVFGSAWDAARYRAVLHACALDAEIAAMPAGDGTHVGERGVTLSGGQRARLALACALYQDTDILLLDDVLAAVDAHVAAWLLAHALLGPLAAGRTRILATHSAAAAAAADVLVHMAGGRAVRVEHRMQQRLLLAPAGSALRAASAGSAEESEAVDAGEHHSQPTRNAHHPAEGHSAVSDQLPSQALAAGIAAADATHSSPHMTSDMASGIGMHAADSPQAADGAKSTAIAVEDEEGREVGHVRARVYWAYIKAVGLTLAAVILISLVLMQATRNGNDLWLAYWVGHTGSSAPPPQAHARMTSQQSLLRAPDCQQQPLPMMATWPQPAALAVQQVDAAAVAAVSGSWLSPSPCRTDSWLQPALPELQHLLGVPAAAWQTPGWLVGQDVRLDGAADKQTRFYLIVLFAIIGANALFTLVRAFAFAGGGLIAARRMHQRLLAAIAAAPLSFFDVTPGGRVLNRLSSDTAIADDALPFIANILLANAAALVGVAAVLCVSQPWLAAMLLPLSLMYRWLQAYYQRTARELRRLASLARSPVYGTFAEALEGAPVLRAYGQQAAWADKNVHQVAALQRANIAGVAAAQWLALRLQLLASVVVTLVAGLAVAQHLRLLPGASTGSSAAGLVGLSLAYALPITGLLGGLLSASAETEQEMVAVERILEYSHLPSEAALLDGKVDASAQQSPQKVARQQQRQVTPTRPLASFSDDGQQQGLAVVFEDVRLRYRAAGQRALDGVNLAVPAGGSLGIVGRTGAGKSSLLTALLRLAPLEGGRVLLGGTDTATLPLQQLRSAVGVVPQTPFLFEGSIRENLDPLSHHTDEEMEAVLCVVHLWVPLQALHAQRTVSSPASPDKSHGAPAAGHIPAAPELAGQHAPDSTAACSPQAGHAGRPPDAERSAVIAHASGSSREGCLTGASAALGAAASAAHSSAGVAECARGQLLSLGLGEGGTGLSSGQQQLLCLGRVLLQRPPLVFLDEATANVDAATADCMQAALRNGLPGATVLQVAHRPQAVMGCNRVAVMEASRVREVGPPQELLSDARSAFAALCASGNG